MIKIGIFKDFITRAFEYYNNDPNTTSITQQDNETAITVELIKAGMLDVGYTKLSNSPDVMMAVDRVSDLVSSMTIHLMQNTDKGDKRVMNALSRKIDIEPCKHMTRKSWITRIVKDLLLNGDGNAILEVKTDSEGLIQDLIPMDMSLVSYEELKNGDYRVIYNDKRYSSDSIVHFVLNPDDRKPWLGKGNRVTLNDIVKNLSQATATKNSFMTSEYMPSLVVQVDALNDTLSSEEGQEGIRQKYLRAKKGEPWIIPADLLEIQQIKPLSLNDLAINDSVELDKRTVAGIFGVPAFFLGVGDFNRFEYNNFINTKVMSIAQIIAQTLTRDLLYSPDYYFKLNPRSLYSYDLNELVTAGGMMVRMNAMRRNELRNWVGLTPDEEMDELLVLENYLKQEDIDKQKKLIQDSD